MLQHQQVFEPVPVSWNTRDVLLFANSIGCSDLIYLYEGHNAFQCFPTYPLMLSFKHAHTSTISFREHFDRYINVQIPGVPRLDSTKAVDGGRSLRIYRKLPRSSHGRQFMLRTIVEEVSDKGSKGTVVELKHLIFERIADSNTEQQYAEIKESVFYVGQGGWSGGLGPRKTTPPKVQVPANRPPILTHRHHVSPQAHLLYRLNGDYNPLHADPESASAVAFGGVIMHGLYSWNVTARVIVEEVTKLFPAFSRTDNPVSLPSLINFDGRFLSMVRPGDTLLISIWTAEEYEQQPKSQSQSPYDKFDNRGGSSLLLPLIYSVTIEEDQYQHQQNNKPCLTGQAILDLGRRDPKRSPSTFQNARM